MALHTLTKFHSKMTTVIEYEDTLLYVIVHDIFLAIVLGESDMTESTYQSIGANKTNWYRNEELFHWLKSESEQI